MEQMRILVTSDCNLKCTHCYQHYDKNKWRLSFEKITELIDYAEKKHVNTLFFSGGEFFTHDSAYKIIESCMDKGLNITLATNGIYVNTDFFEKYAKLHKITFQISIDGMKMNHNKRRGESSFEKTMCTVKKLRNLGVPIICSMAVDETNFMDMIHVLHIPEFSKVNFLPVAHTGAAKNICRSYDDMAYQYYEKTLLNIYRKHIALGKSTSLYPDSLGIKYNGDVYLSPVAQDMDVFCIGNIYEDSLDSILESYEKRDLYELIRRNNDILIECKKCEKNQQCVGKSIERAYKVNGNIEGSDPWGCRIFKNLYSEIPIGQVFWGDL